MALPPKARCGLSALAGPRDLEGGAQGGLTSIKRVQLGADRIGV